MEQKNLPISKGGIRSDETHRPEPGPFLEDVTNVQFLIVNPGTFSEL